MDEITASPSDDVPNLQRTVQRNLGRCLLQLQQYEKLLKVMVSHNELNGPMDQMHAIREQKTSSVQQQTMGTLVNMLTESYLTSPGADQKTSQSKTDIADQNWASYRFQLEMPSEHYEMTKSALRELVVLRNAMVHNFIDQYDLWSAEGCAAADDFLKESYKTIHLHYLNLRDWAKSMFDARTAMASWLDSQGYEDMLESIRANTSVNRPGNEICRCLHEAQAKLGEHGWTHLGKAIRWIANCYPDQTPERYGFKSWKQVLHESGQFEIRNARADNQPTVAWYRCKAP